MDVAMVPPELPEKPAGSPVDPGWIPGGSPVDPRWIPGGFRLNPRIGKSPIQISSKLHRYSAVFLIGFWMVFGSLLNSIVDDFLCFLHHFSE